MACLPADSAEMRWCCWGAPGDWMPVPCEDRDCCPSYADISEDSELALALALALDGRESACDSCVGAVTRVSASPARALVDDAKKGASPRSCSIPTGDKCCSSQVLPHPFLVVVLVVLGGDVGDAVLDSRNCSYARYCARSSSSKFIGCCCWCCCCWWW